MRCLVLTGSFKDVFSPYEASVMLKETLPNSMEVTTIPFVDGGEYTYEVLKKLPEYEEILIDGIINPYFNRVTCGYLVKSDEAHIVSSEILRLYPNEDKFKNPLSLTDYGLGQLIHDAIIRGYKKINVYLGGTSTVSCGLGLAQALGTCFFDENGQEITDYICGADLNRISRIVNTPLNDVKIQLIVDGNANLFDMREISKLKISKSLFSQQEQILDELELGISHICELIGFNKKTDFSGAAGGILIGISMFTKVDCTLGGEYFEKLFDVVDEIKKCDFVLTGEGRFDNSACGKSPVYVSRLAKRYGKLVILACGKVDSNVISKKESIIHIDKELSNSLGIDLVVTCQKEFDEMCKFLDYEKRIEIYKHFTGSVLHKLMKEIFDESGNFISRER